MSYNSKKSNGIGRFLFIVTAIACMCYTGYDLINIGRDYVSNIKYKPTSDTVLVDSSKVIIDTSKVYFEKSEYAKLKFSIDSGNAAISNKIDSINATKPVTDGI